MCLIIIWELHVLMLPNKNRSFINNAIKGIKSLKKKIQYFSILIQYFKGYLRHKTIFSQYVSSEAQINPLNAKVEQRFAGQINWLVFIWWQYWRLMSWESFCFAEELCSMIYQICDVMMSMSTWEKVHFLMYLLNHNLRSPNLGNW